MRESKNETQRPQRPQKILFFFLSLVVPQFRCSSSAVSAVSAFHSLTLLFSSIVGLVALTPALGNAQRQPTPQPGINVEGRLDAIVASRSALQAGLGLTTSAGTYVRTGIVGALGASPDGLSGRFDAFARYHLDPFRESHWAPYGGGGISVRMDQHTRTKTFLLIFAGVDGPARNGLTTSVEAGLGGGARFGVILRRAVTERR